MFCPDCGSWNRSALRACARCTHTLPEVRGPSEVPDALVTALRHALGARYRIVRRVFTNSLTETDVTALERIFGKVLEAD